MSFLLISFVYEFLLHDLVPYFISWQAFSWTIKISECVPNPRRHMQPSKLRAPPKTTKKKLNLALPKVEQVAITLLDEDAVVKEKEFDDLFRTLTDPEQKEVLPIETPKPQMWLVVNVGSGAVRHVAFRYCSQ